MTDIAERTDLSKGAVYKHLSTLRDHGYVVKHGNEYTLGFRFLDYGGWLRSRYVGADLIKPRTRELADRTGEIASFAMWENDRMVTLFRESGNRGVSSRTRLGCRMHLHQMAGGKAILSRLPRAHVRDVIDSAGLPPATPQTITDEEEFLEELDAIRERGYSVNEEESTKGLVAVAVPVVPDETVIGACSIAGPRHRMDEERVSGEIVDLLLNAANELELNISHAQASPRFGTR
ncbi:IclR family transcriptional regulator [Halobacterium sp. KA-4]|uniref:IclR family transcriptional regulator n=1 Tax=Halobacterium sp. KA-4 TaxID=2896367 RepID=UPI001E468965|nr:IclR family transcriptional regulator [Halobacterium sp. KA-4]MCD2201721.1 IclR family transcriptional regulator [Halobacterium sp. KA-4]